MKIIALSRERAGRHHYEVPYRRDFVTSVIWYNQGHSCDDPL